MTRWIVTISEQYPHLWNIAKENFHWDFPGRRPIRNGDDVFFWQTGRQRRLLAHVRATTDVTELLANSDRPWDPRDPTLYTHRFWFRLLGEGARASSDVVSARGRYRQRSPLQRRRQDRLSGRGSDLGRIRRRSPG